MATTIQCPACQRHLRLPDTVVGKRVRCPSCKAEFVAGEREEGREQVREEEPVLCVAEEGAVSQ